MQILKKTDYTIYCPISSLQKRTHPVPHSARGTPIPDNECRQDASQGCIPPATTLSAFIWRFRADLCWKILFT